MNMQEEARMAAMEGDPEEMESMLQKEKSVILLILQLMFPTKMDQNLSFHWFM